MATDSVESPLHCLDVLLLLLAFFPEFLHFASQLFLDQSIGLDSLDLSLQLVFLSEDASLLCTLPFDNLLVLGIQSLLIAFVGLPFLL